MRKICTLLSIFALFLASYGYAYAQDFQDIPRTSRFYRAVSHLVQSEAIDNDKSFFHLYRPVNRAEAVKMILVASGRDEEDVSGNNHIRFRVRDIKTDEWYYPHAYRAIKLGIVSGYPDGTFRGANTINLVEALKVLFEAYDLPVLEPRGGTGFFGSDPGAWYHNYLYSAQQYSILTNYEYIKPDRLVSRAFFAELLYRVELMGEGETRYLNAVGKDFNITIPRLGVQNVTLKTTDPFDHDYYIWVLNQGIGHALKYPGENGKIFIYGHSSGYSWYNEAYKKVFRALNELEEGDEIIINYRGAEYKYYVTGRDIRRPDDLSVLQDSNKEQLAILTCWPPDSTRERYLIYAEPRS
jgi:LPXTG-site transpeptidase (sortase) family protein